MSVSLKLSSPFQVSVGPGETSSTVQSFANTHPSFHRYAQLQLIRDAKECVCRINSKAPTEGAPLDSTAWEYEMPDGSAIDFGWERLHLPEVNIYINYICI